MQETSTQEPPALVRLVQAVAEQVEEAIKDERSPEFSSAHGTTGMTDADLFTRMVDKVLAKNHDPRLQSMERDALVQAIRDVLDRKRGAKPWQNKP